MERARFSLSAPTDGSRRPRVRPVWRRGEHELPHGHLAVALRAEADAALARPGPDAEDVGDGRVARLARLAREELHAVAQAGPVRGRVSAQAGDHIAGSAGGLGVPAAVEGAANR